MFRFCFVSNKNIFFFLEWIISNANRRGIWHSSTPSLTRHTHTHIHTNTHIVIAWMLQAIYWSVAVTQLRVSLAILTFPLGDGDNLVPRDASHVNNAQANTWTYLLENFITSESHCSWRKCNAVYVGDNSLLVYSGNCEGITRRNKALITICCEHPLMHVTFFPSNF